MAKYPTFDQNELWPPKSNSTSEAKLKVSNGHSSETMIDIKTNSFLQSPLVKYATFDQNELWPPRSNLTSEAKLKISNGHSSETMIDIKTISFLQSSLVKYATFDRNELWPSSTNMTSEAKFKISNVHSSEVIMDIKTISCISDYIWRTTNKTGDTVKKQVKEKLSFQNGYTSSLAKKRPHLIAFLHNYHQWVKVFEFEWIQNI